MTLLSAVTSFAVIAGLLTIVPGLDTALVLRASVTQGRRCGFATALGIGSGVMVWGAAAGLGVSALLAASHAAYDALRLAGAAYLLWLGANMLWRTWRTRPARTKAAAPAETVLAAHPPPAAAASAGRARGGMLASWSRGLATNLLNPKVGVFYLAMLPQFRPAGVPHLLVGVLLAGVHDAEGIVWFTMLIAAAHRARRWLGRAQARRTMDRVAGAVLIGFGLKLALAKS